jgi:hypothetical protein
MTMSNLFDKPIFSLYWIPVFAGMTLSGGVKIRPVF